MLFPMWVLPISIFLTMSGSPKSHQELHEEGKLVQSGAQVLDQATSSAVHCAFVLLRHSAGTSVS